MLIDFNEEELKLLHSVISNVAHSSLAYKPVFEKLSKLIGYPVPLDSDDSYNNIAKLIMKEIQYDSGAVDRWNPENYPLKWVQLISSALKTFMESNRSFEISERNIQRIAGSDEEEGNYFSSLPNWELLDNVLNAYSDRDDADDKFKGEWELLNYKYAAKKDWVYKCRRCGCQRIGTTPQICNCDWEDFK